MKPITIDFLKLYYNSLIPELSFYADYFESLNETDYDFCRVMYLCNKLCDIADCIYETIRISENTGIKEFEELNISAINFCFDYTTLQFHLPLPNFCQN